MIAKLWKEPRCPTKDEWIKKMWSMYTMEYYSAIRNDKYPPCASYDCLKSYVFLGFVLFSLFFFFSPKPAILWDVVPTGCSTMYVNAALNFSVQRLCHMHRIRAQSLDMATFFDSNRKE